MAEKNCSKCGDLKPLEQFYRMKAHSTGYGPWCKGCMDVRKRAWVKANPERYRATQLRNAKKRSKAVWQRKKNDPEHQEYMRQYSAKWYAENKDRLKAIRRAWYLKNKAEHNKRSRDGYYKDPDGWKEKCRKWAEKNPDRWREMMRASDNKRRALKAGAKGVWTTQDVKEKFDLQRGKCAVCRNDLPKSYHRDHIVPLARGGSNEKHNLQLLCKSCNSRKHKKDPINFMQENGYLL